MHIIFLTQKFCHTKLPHLTRILTNVGKKCRAIITPQHCSTEHSHVLRILHIAEYFGYRFPFADTNKGKQQKQSTFILLNDVSSALKNTT
jgi:hypothetical protein